MGNQLSVSSIVDKLHALEPEARSTAFDILYEQHNEIRHYLKVKYHENPVPLSRPQSQPSRSQVLSIHEFVQDEQEKLTAEYASWSKDITSFWITKSSTFIPEETSCRPLRFIYKATVRQELESHNSCLRSRYLALFWFDYYTTRFLKGFDRDYEVLGREIGGSESKGDDSIVSTLRELVKAGRRYHKLTERFGNGILLALPSSIGRSTLELKLPLNQQAFERFVSPLVGSGWEKYANTNLISSLGASIRRSLLERCPKSDKKKPHPNSSQSPRSFRISKTQKRPGDVTIQSRITSPSTDSPSTPRVLQQVYSLEAYGVARDACQDNQGHHKVQDLRTATPERALATNVHNVACIPLNTSPIHDPGTLAQAGDDLLLHLCGAGNLPLAASGGGAEPGNLIYATNATSHNQDMERAPRNAQAARNQKAMEESGDMAQLAREETTWNKDSRTRGNSDVVCEGNPMLSSLSAADSENCDTGVFIPEPFEPDLFMPVPFEFDPDPFLIAAGLGMSSSPI